ncbi:MAG TPA: aminotransferase class III-fold pyridoxal phosphate-dependent enzyme [bacterium]|nr:aminotransferase class III-fold pyridoxal phosphate-dependent enzyme [bacterium]
MPETIHSFDRSLAEFRRALAVIPAGSQTNSKRPGRFAFGRYPIYASHGRGGHIWDIDGNEYVDFVMALGPITLGYCYPAVDEAIKVQLGRGIIYSLLAEVEVAAAEAVVAAVPCAEQVRFLKSGGEATSAAARIARAYTGREKVANCGYRGWHDQWMISGNEEGVPHALRAHTLPFEFNNLSSLETALDSNRGAVAAVILDPARRDVPAPGFLEGVRELARAHGALLIFDEVVTGFRVALGGAQEYFGVTPDLACFAKGVANGMPLAAVCGSRAVMQAAERLTVTTTYGGEALSLAAAVATINEYRTEKVFAHVWRLGERLMRGLNDAARSAGVAFRCFGLAPMSAMKFDSAAPDAEALSWSYFLQETARRGVLFRRGGLNFVAFTHTEQDIDTSTAIVREVLGGLRRHLDAGSLRRAVPDEREVQRL